MRVDRWLMRAQRQLVAAGVGTARLDALVLLEDIAGCDRAWLLAHPEHELTAAQAQVLQKLLSRRASHEPLAYVRGKTEFYGRTFLLTPAVLEPRPESETMIDLLKELVKNREKSNLDSRKLRIADVGTGSGALGITAQLELPTAVTDLLELDPKAIKVAKTNVDLFTLNISVLQGDLLADNPQDYHILLCNLPYVPDNFHINPAAAREPHLAIFGGPDGLDIYRRLFEQLQDRSRKPLYILTESLPPQHEVLADIAGHAGYVLHQEDDFIQVFSQTL